MKVVAAHSKEWSLFYGDCYVNNLISEIDII